MNAKESMFMCPDCSYTWSDEIADHGEQYRVFCPKHDLYDARYTDGRPLMDDVCPACEIDRHMCIKINEGRFRDGKPEIEAVVVESDWPEYEPTWEAIKKRMEEAP